MDTQYVSPEELVIQATISGCAGISWTFNEPVTWFEYTYDAARIATSRGLRTNYVTNGFISERAFDMIAPYLDVFRVDVKGFSEKTYQQLCHTDDYRGVLSRVENAAQCGMHVEIVTNIIPGFNDERSQLRNIAAWIRNSLGADTPWHVTRFYPHHELMHMSATPISTLEHAWLIGRAEGLRYVYLGNVPGHKWEHTYCHECGTLLIKRSVFDILENNLKNGMCPACNTIIPGTFN
jgi:pyruvate formate lyase activating enzyme